MSANLSPLSSAPAGDGPKAHVLSGSGLILRRLGRINPDSLDDYVATGGYAALRRAVADLGAGAVIETIARAGLRGRGGAGFDTARKWRIAVETAADERFIIANALGADPASFGDRTLLENDPHAVLEGLAIAAFAVGARRAFVYCCFDHSLALQRIARAVRQAEERGYLGSAIFGTGFDCHVTVVPAPAGFAAGEETAAIALIEGKRPMPESRPPYPAESGLWGRPTVVNNAETLANVPWILDNGAERFATFGCPESHGTKLLSVIGRVNRPGVVEVPLGVTLAQVIDDGAGGLRSGNRLKAVQIGGPTGACLPASSLDLHLDFAALSAAGASLGSGSLLVLDETACIVDFALSQTKLLANESCGRCVPCRLGTSRLALVLGKVASGQGRPGDLELLLELSQNISDGAVCGYGIGAGNLVRTTIEHFRAECEAHVIEKRCPAGRCALGDNKTPETRAELWRRTWPIPR